MAKRKFPVELLQELYEAYWTTPYTLSEGDFTGYELVEVGDAEDYSRWMNSRSAVLKAPDTGKFYQFFWAVGKSEDCDGQPPSKFYGGEETELDEVEQVEVTVKEWVNVK